MAGMVRWAEPFSSTSVRNAVVATRGQRQDSIRTFSCSFFVLFYAPLQTILAKLCQI